MLIAALVVLGLVSMPRLDVGLFPDVDVPVVTVTTRLPGAAPESVERSVTQPLEEAINVIDGVDKAGGKARGGGRGVAIGVTWNASAEIRRNRVTRYWKGIGLFVDARGTVEENVVEEMLTWGIAFWDAGRGKPVGKSNTTSYSIPGPP